MNQLTQKIKAKIKIKKPKSKWQFIVFVIAKDIFLVMLMIIAIIATGIVIYIINQYNPWEYLPHGFLFYIQCLMALPWELIVILLLLIISVYFLARKVHFMYRTSKITMTSIILVLIFGGYVLAETTGINKFISSKPVAREIYQKQGKFFQHQNGPITIGEIANKKEGEIILIDMGNNQWKVLITDKTRMKNNFTLNINKKIMIIGKKKNYEIEAYGIKEIDDDFRGFQKLDLKPPAELLY